MFGLQHHRLYNQELAIEIVSNNGRSTFTLNCSDHNVKQCDTIIHLELIVYSLRLYVSGLNMNVNTRSLRV